MIHLHNRQTFTIKYIRLKEIGQTFYMVIPHVPLDQQKNLIIRQIPPIYFIQNTFALKN
jgi:hypothetical protein